MSGMNPDRPLRDIPPALLVDSLSTALVVTDATLRVRVVNPAAEMLFAVGARQVRGMALADAIPHLRDQIARLRGAMATDVPMTARELVLHGPGAADMTVDYTATPLHDPANSSGLLLEIVARDRHVRISRDENILAQHLASREVIRGLAHEIKNPLGGLRGAAQLLERELERDELREFTRIIIGEADRLRSLVDRLLGPDRPPRMAAVNIHRLVEHVRHLVLAELPGGVVIERDYDPSIPDLCGDEEQLIQSLLNLVRNAVQAVGRRGRIVLRTRTRRKLTIGRRCHRLVACIDVVDDGPGVPAEILEQIFYPLVSTRAEGTGLGLSIAQYLVHAHGGLVECRSRPGETAFSIILPLETMP